MMDSLEKYINDNKSLFEQEPDDGHFERLRQKMIYRSYEKRIAALRWGMSIAATVAIMFMAGFFLMQNEKQGEVICEISDNMQTCYLEKMIELANRIEELIIGLDYWDRQIVMNNVNYIIETVSGDFENTLPRELPADMLKEILIDFYQQNFEGLKLIERRVMN